MGSSFKVYKNMSMVWRKSEDYEKNKWDPLTHPLKIREDEAGIWEGFIPGIKNKEKTNYAK